MGIPVLKGTIRRKKIMPGEKAADELLTLDQELKMSMLECIDRFQQDMDTRCEGQYIGTSSTLPAYPKHFYFGPQLIISVTDSELAKEILNHPLALARPPHAFDFVYAKGGFIGLNGEEWQEQRRFAVSTMRNLGLGKGLWESMIQRDALEFANEMKQAGGQPVLFIEPIALSQISNSLSLLFGRPLDRERDKQDVITIRNFSKLQAEQGSSTSIQITLPWLTKIVEFFNLFNFQMFIKELRKMEAIFEREVTRRLQSEEELTKDDFIGCYLQEMQERDKFGKPHSFTVANLRGNLLILFLSGQDSTIASLSWLMLLMAKYKDVQKKVCDEIDNVIGRDGVVSYNDRAKLPYTTAVQNEMMRWIAINPIFAPRYVMDSFELAGYTIPKGSNILCNSWAMLHDPRYFDDPMAFKPERFLSEDGSKVINLKGYGPFSFGKRNCPGEGVAMMTMYIYFATIMQKFSIKMPNEDEPDLTYKYSAGVLPVPQEICFIER
ncbi:Cytochrome P450 2J1 [Araneus ventricosus]|uniref:Cytochrome P450 2J1 n=1 Tax=Araneus ventricosus TaxID=182803 RepID=A0A4Y2GCW2_ARAVE|nr:Cytochrome P450 2J1 [Araneus ventricosus]